MTVSIAVYKARDPNPEDGANKPSASCAGVESVAEDSSNIEIEILYPTSSEVSTMSSSGESAVPVSGGAILKIPGLPDVKTETSPQPIAKIIKTLIDQGDFRDALDAIDTPEEGEDGGEELKVPNIDAASTELKSCFF